MREQAVAVAKLRKQVQARLGAAGFLARRKAEAPGVLAVLDDLSERLPDDTWLQRFNIGNDGRVGMQGESPQASHLIDLLKASPSSATTPRAKQGRSSLAARRYVLYPQLGTSLATNRSVRFRPNGFSKAP